MISDVILEGLQYFENEDKSIKALKEIVTISKISIEEAELLISLLIPFTESGNNQIRAHALDAYEHLKAKTPRAYQNNQPHQEIIQNVKPVIDSPVISNVGIQEKEDRTKIGGWLRFFIIVWLFILPISALGSHEQLVLRVENSNSKIASLVQWEKLKVDLRSLCLAGIVYAIITAFLLSYYKEPFSVKNAICYLWVSYILFDMIQFGYFDSIPLSYNKLGVVIPHAIWATIWTVYFTRSEKIQDIYYNRTLV